MLDAFLGQVADPFRIVLSLGLVLTMLRTRAVSGTWVPLAAGVAFIAVLLPLTVDAGAGPVLPAFLLGLVSTGVIVAVILAARALVLRATGR